MSLYKFFFIEPFPMIKLSKSDINSLIAKYFEEEGYIYSKYTFTAETKLELEQIRDNLDLVSLVAMGLQCLYGVEHFNDNLVTPCDVLYTISGDHKCETVVKDAHLKVNLVQEDTETDTNEKKAKTRRPKRKKIDKVEQESLDKTPIVETNNVKEIKRKGKRKKKPVEDKSEVTNEEVPHTNETNSPDNEEQPTTNEEGPTTNEEVPTTNELEHNTKTESCDETHKETPNEVIKLVGDLKSTRVVEFSERPLTECKEAELVAWHGDYLAVKTVGNELFNFRFGCFMWKISIVNISVIQWNSLGLVTGEKNGRLTIMNPINYRRRVFEKHTDVVINILIRHRKLFTASKDGFIYSIDDPCSIKVFGDGIKDAVFIDNWRVFCTSFEGALAVVDVETNALTSLEGHLRPITCLDQTENIVSTGSEDGFISVYQFTKAKQIFFKAHSTGVAFQCWVGEFLISSDKNNFIKVWDKERILNGNKDELVPIGTYEYPGTIRKMKSKNNILAVIADDQMISLFDDQMGLISRYSLLGMPKDFDFSEAGDSICVLLEDNYPVIINIIPK